MPSVLVTALSAPIRDVGSMVGPGHTGAPALSGVLAGMRNRLAGLSEQLGQTWSTAAAGWSGTAADRASEFIADTAAVAGALATNADRLATGFDAASTAVATARARLQAIVEEFEARATALEPHLDAPGAADELLAEARLSLNEAIAVVDDLRRELDREATTIAESPPSPATGAGHSGATVPAGLDPTASTGSGWRSPPAPGSGGPPAFTMQEIARDVLSESGQAAPAADPDAFGSGVDVRLPDGSTVSAPNVVAAGAVRHALTQLGVPYQWGGVTPGVGLDCSGLTQWAYDQAGLNIPRLAQEQDVGAAVAAGSLMPGDLAVWDGHVAMVVGNGMMIEAGDPVQLSTVRTTNAGQGFRGFFRPTT